MEINAFEIYSYREKFISFERDYKLTPILTIR